MGFKEIYLLGCEATLMQPSFDLLLNREVENLHAYNNTKEELESYKFQLRSGGFATKLYSFANLIKGYGYISRYCEKQGIILVNLTPQTLIDSIERANLSDVL